MASTRSSSVASPIGRPRFAPIWPNVPWGRAGRVAWAATRDEVLPGAGEIAAVWADLGAALGLRQGALDAVCGRRSGHDPSIDERHFGAALLAGGPAEVTRRETVGAWAASLRRGTTAESVGRCVDQLVPGGPTGVAEPVVAPARVVAPPGVLGSSAAPGGPRSARRLARGRPLPRPLPGPLGGSASTPDAERASGRAWPGRRRPKSAEHLAVARQVREVPPCPRPGTGAGRAPRPWASAAGDPAHRAAPAGPPRARRSERRSDRAGHARAGGGGPG